MKTHLRLILTKLLFLFLTTQSLALTISQEEAAQLVIRQSHKSDEINSKYQQYFLSPAQSLSNYDWKLTIEGGSETDRNQTLQLAHTSPNTQYFYDRYIFTTTLSKQLGSFGTQFSFSIDQRSELLSTVSSGTNTNYPALTQDTLGLTIEQPLWANYFGSADQANILNSEFNFKSNYILRLDELQNLVLDAIKLYWKTYVSEQKLKQDITSRENYKKLVQSVTRKKSLGYTAPGELEQTEAEYENREQAVKISSQDFLQNLDQLKTLLGIAKNEDVQFKEVKALPEPPKFKATPVEQLRPIKSQKFKTLAAEQAYFVSKSKSHPTFNLVGKTYNESVDQDASKSQSYMWSGKNPKYYIGLKFQYSFGSDVLAEEEIHNKSNFELEKSAERRKIKEFEDQSEVLKNSVLTNYFVVSSKKKQVEIRKKAMEELSKTFNQGRTDINILIDNMNKYYASETDYTKSVGDYFIALNQLAAFNDELVVGDSLTEHKGGK